MSPVVSVPSRATPDASNIRYQSPQPKISSTLPPPVRSHSVSQSNSFINNKGFFVKSEPLGGHGRNLSKEADHVPVPKPRSPLKVERTPDMVCKHLSSPCISSFTFSFLFRRKIFLPTRSKAQFSIYLIRLFSK